MKFAPHYALWKDVILFFVIGVILCTPLLFIDLPLIEPPSSRAQSPGESPKEALSPKLYDQLQGKTDPLAEALKEMRDKLDHFGVEHASIFVELRGINQALIDMQREVNADRARIDSMDPSKAAERLRALEDFMAEQKKASEDRWANIMSWLRVVASLIGGLIANETRKSVAGWWKKRKAEKGVDSPSGTGA